ncbi:MAG: ABC transporter ATP-binding protein [Pseudopedobacter saltans]|uniref:ABC transporter ATP-binding protein n=1 Tax=Pseudopedobacter saltans TaxID=151895 RepID=A0A2W5E5S3_9SPHI|nr:MAG: ABC transporter ATP-binding protein [Pseudopedobacter saltans]
MNDIALKVENVSKQYRLGTVGTGTLSQDLNRWFAKVRGKEDPFLKIGETNDRTSTGNSDFVWALRDLNFEIKKGDVVGIIGRNGAGKSTLLKLLSKTTLPTTGKIKINGRIASLLEVGTGFHPELTGRDNIFLNGAILDMTKKEIQSKFDEIVDFAGVARYVDTPVKRYSSGMYVRLAFAVAAHLDPDILIVDEVLAVGDAEFQKKAIGKMKSVSEEGGRTVLFVSHNMAAVSSLCNLSIFMKQGSIHDFDLTSKIIDKYISSDSNFDAEVKNSDIIVTKRSSVANFKAVRLMSSVRGVTSNFAIDEEIIIEFEFEILEDGAMVSPSIHLLSNMDNCILATFNAPSASLTYDALYNRPLERGVYRSVCKIPPNFLNNKSYFLSFFLVPKDPSDIGIAEKVISFTITETGEMRKEYTGDWWGDVRPRLAWRTEKIQ